MNVGKKKQKNLNFYVKNSLSTQVEKQLYPSFVLTKDTWDDFDFKTLYHLYFFQSKANYFKIGSVKILDKQNLVTKLSGSFVEVDEVRYCSLGQSVSYYNKLKELEDEFDVKLMLNNLNDIAYNFGLLDDFEGEVGFNTSLLRFSDAAKALQEGKKIIDGIKFSNAFKFTFSCKLQNAEKEHLLNINFSDKGLKIPNRIIALVGKNGTGKTQVLAKLANTLSGNNKEGNFGDKYRPPFSKVIAISYSLFDKFDIPSNTKTFSYVYCGIREKSGSLNVTEDKLLKRLQKAINKINFKNRQPFYFRALKEVLNENIIEDLLGDSGDFKNEFIDKIISNRISLSSGQSMYIYILSEIFANIENESLLLFDEPETHLHPNAISKIINLLYEILDEYNSYSIIGTHSPILIQQVPSQFVLVFEREGNIPIIRTLGIESFGETLTNITEDIFDTINVEENYKTQLKKISHDYSYDQIIREFENSLSLNTRIYLKQLYKNEKPNTNK